MKHVVWSDQYIDGGRAFRGRLGALPAYGNWARDIRVLAWPVPAAPKTGVVSIRSEGTGGDLLSVHDGNPHTFSAGPKTTEKEWRLTYAFPQKRTIARVDLYFKNTIWKGQQEIIVTVRDGSLALGEHRFKQSELELPVSFSFPRAEVERCVLEISVPADSMVSADQFGLREAEILDASEKARWQCELVDWSVQIVETSGQFSEASRPGMPVHGVVESGATIDLTDHVVAGELIWTPPPGVWRVVRFGYASTGKKIQPTQLGGRGLETDKMSVVATERQFQAYAGRILEAAAEHQAVFDLLVADSWESGMQNWTDDLPVEFERRRGYAMTPYLPILAGAVVGDMERTVRFLNDFRETISDLIIERYYGRARELARQAGLSFAAEFSNAGPKLDAFRMTRAIDLPMDEIWSDTRAGGLPPIPAGPIRPMLMSSAAFVEGKTIAPCETYTSFWADWRRTPGDFGYAGDLAFFLGMNQLILHSTVHQPTEQKPGLTLQGFGQHFQRHNTWWPLTADWLREISRKQYILQNTEAVFNLLVYYGDTLPRADTAQMSVELPAYMRPLVIDQDALIHRVTVANGSLQLDGDGNYGAIMLANNSMYPEGLPMHLATLRRLADLVHAGAVLVGQPPPRPPGLAGFPASDVQFQQLRDALWGNVRKGSGDPIAYGSGRVYVAQRVEAVLADLGYKPDWECKPTRSSDLELKYSWRKDTEGDLCFIFNPNPHSAAFVCRVQDRADRRPVLWEPSTGRTTPIFTFLHEDDRLAFPVELEAKQSAFVRFESRPGEQHSLRRIVLRPTDADPFTGVTGIVWTKSRAGDWQAWADDAKRVFATDEQGRIADVSFPPVRRLIPHPALAVRFDQLPVLGLQTLQTLGAWNDSSDERIRSYSGLAHYNVELDVSEEFLASAGEVTLDLGEVGRVARLAINGIPVGTRWRSPFSFAVGRMIHPGKNHLTVEVANTWLNRLLADTGRPASERTSWTPWPRLVQWTSQGLGPEQSGWIGPLTLTAFPLVTPRFETP